MFVENDSRLVNFQPARALDHERQPEQNRPEPRSLWVSVKRTILGASLAALIGVLSGNSYAQVASGSIEGTVMDPSGATVPNCTVTVTNTDTGFVRSAQSSSAGIYGLPSLQPGSYRVSVTAPGFATETSSVLVVLNQTSRADFHLQVASGSQTIEVKASMQQLETDSHELGAVFSAQTVENLPSANRDVFSTLTAAPTVASYATSEGNSASDIDFFGTGRNSLTIGGTTYGTTSYLQDGVTNYNLLVKTANLQPSPEDVQEATVQSNGASARYEGPSVVNIITKGGTNQYHGRVYDYLRNDAFNATPYLSTINPPLRYNQFGANVGGPILHNRLLFFVAYDGLRSKTAYTGGAAVPTAAERAGDFSADNFTIYDPSTYNATSQTISAFPGNIIPQNRISAFAIQFLPYLPLPNQCSLPGCNYQFQPTPTNNYDQYLARLDYHAGNNDSLYGAVLIGRNISSSASFSPSPIFTNQNIQNGTNAYVQETHTFSPTTVNVARFGYNRSKVFETEAGAGAQPYSQGFNLPFVTPAPIQELPPTVGFSAHSGLGNSFAPDGATQKLYEYADEVNKVIGKHSLFFGVDVNQVDFNASWVIWNNGEMDFNGQFTSDHAPNPTGGSDIADFLLGLPSTAFGAEGYTVGDFRQTFFMPYVQDDWKITRKLTLNAGLRYDYYQAPYDKNGHSNVYDVATNTNHKGTFNQNYRQFAPRVGFAYSLNDRTVVRGGYGIYYSPFFYNQLQFLLANPPNYILEINSFAPNNPTPVSQSLTPNPTGSGLSPFTTDLKMPTPYVQQWNVGVQRSIGTWMASLAYLGSMMTHLQEQINPNQASPPDPNNITPVDSRRPYPWVGDILDATDIARGNYNALQAELDRRFANGFSFSASNVWSKALDTMSSDNSYSRYAYNVGLDYGRADFDRTDVFKLSGVYKLPFGNASRSKGVTRTLLGGWQVSGIFIAESGTPASALANDYSQTGGNHAQYANQVCNPNALSHKTFTHWFDTNCFVQPGNGVLGSAPRNDIIGPRYVNLDASAFKSFSFSESRAVEFRADFLGALNHPQFALTPYSQSVANDPRYGGSGSFGSLGVLGGNRIIQLSLKLLF